MVRSILRTYISPEHPSDELSALIQQRRQVEQYQFWMWFRNPSFDANTNLISIHGCYLVDREWFASWVDFLKGKGLLHWLAVIDSDTYASYDKVHLKSQAEFQMTICYPRMDRSNQTLLWGGILCCSVNALAHSLHVFMALMDRLHL